MTLHEGIMQTKTRRDVKTVPKKTIYVREEDIPVFDEAMEKLGGEESMSSVIVDALRERLRDRKKEEEEALHLAMALECFLPSVLAECVERRLRDFPEDVVAKSRVAASAAYLADPDFFIERGYYELDDARWVEEAKTKVGQGLRLLRDAMSRAETPMDDGMASRDKEKIRAAKVQALLSELESLGGLKEKE